MRKAKYANRTKESTSICPYCGKDCGEYLNNDGAEAEQYRCENCNEVYYVIFDENSYDPDFDEFTEIDDVTDNNNRSLL